MWRPESVVSFELSEEERMVQQVAHEFAKKEIRPVAAYYDEHEEVPYEIIKKAAGLGFGVSRAGSVLDGSSSSLIPCILSEELSWGCAGIALAINSSGLAGAAIMATGSPEQREEWMARISSDENEVHLGAMCLTEPDAGSDVANIQTTVTRDGDDYILNGNKVYISGGTVADWLTVFARTGGVSQGTSITRGPSSTLMMRSPSESAARLTSAPHTSKCLVQRTRGARRWSHTG